jgi:hypothetical protein
MIYHGNEGNWLMKILFHPLAALHRRVMGFFTRLLTMPLKSYVPRFPNNIENLKYYLKKGDVVLVEGDQRVSEVIKYLTQSSWSHSAIYVGDELIRCNHPLAPALIQEFGNEARYLLIEALVEDGVIASPVSKYINFNIRVCSPHNLRKEDLQVVLDEVIGELGHEYDLKNLFDLARYFLPVSLVPRRFRRKVLQFGSGLPTQVICSSLIARAFGKVGFPILPYITPNDQTEQSRSFSLHRLLFGRDGGSMGLFRRPPSAIVTPRDFDLSPYFEVVKFNIIEGRKFDYRKIMWIEEEYAR